MFYLTAKDVKIWYGSVVLLIASVFPFFYFMFRPRPQTLAISLAVIACTTVSYVVATKRITHAKHKYTALQAMKFFDLCDAEGLRNGSLCKENKKKFAEIASRNEFSAKLDYQQLTEMFKIGKQLKTELKGRK